MNSLQNRIAGSVIACVLPFAVQLPLVIVGRYVAWMPWMPLLFFVFSVLFSSVIGFLFIARPFRRYALLIGMIYFPAMIAALVYFSLLVVGYVFNDHI